MDGAHAGIAGCQAVADLAAAVGGAVVDEDDLERRTLLPEDGGDAGFEAVAHVVYGYDDADHVSPRSFR